jgi:hypothetical protein
VKFVRDDPSLHRDVGSLAEEAAKGGSTKAGAVFNEGDVLSPKIDKVQVLAEPKDGAKVAGTIGRSDEVVVVGGEKDGFVQVQGSTAGGWVKIILMNKR